MVAGNKQLGEFLRSRRTRLDPHALGLSDARRRRTTGLRREEVAGRAGISCEWYVKLEQGREVCPSQATVTALAKALALDIADTAHLRRLTTRTITQPFEAETVPAIVAEIVEGLIDPAYVTGARWDVLAWNGAADQIFRFSTTDVADRNILLMMFTGSEVRTLFGENWASEARRLLALFRAVHDQRANELAFASLVTRLQKASEDFRSWWIAHDVDTPSAGLKSLQLPDGGETAFIYANFQPCDNPALKLSLYRRQP